MTSNPTPDRRAEISAHLWQIAEQHIVAEWICCEPLEPRHDLCAKGYAALGMAKTLLVDSDPEKAWNPAAPVLDAVMQLLPAAPAVSSVVGQTTRDRIAEALAEALKPRYGGPQHNTPGGLPLTASAEEVRLHRAQPLADAVMAALPVDTERLHDQILTLQAELAQLRDLLRTENGRANSAIDRETAAEEAAEEQRLALSQALGLGTGAPWEAIRERATELRRLAVEAQQSAVGAQASADLIEDYLRFLRGQGPEPDLSDLAPQQREAVAGQFEIVRALTDRDPELPPLDRDPVALRLGLTAEQSAVGARQPDTETQAHPPQRAWRVETRDPLANQWAPGSHFAHRPAALERWETANRNAPLWRDGTPVERRIVRETTTYTVEVEHQPSAASAAPGRSAATSTDEETRGPALSEELCPGFPDRCPNLRTVEPEPGVHLGGVRCGCADAASR